MVLVYHSFCTGSTLVEIRKGLENELFRLLFTEVQYLVR